MKSKLMIVLLFLSWFSENRGMEPAESALFYVRVEDKRFPITLTVKENFKIFSTAVEKENEIELSTLTKKTFKILYDLANKDSVEDLVVEKQCNKQSIEKLFALVQSADFLNFEQALPVARNALYNRVLYPADAPEALTALSVITTNSFPDLTVFLADKTKTPLENHFILHSLIYSPLANSTLCSNLSPKAVISLDSSKRILAWINKDDTTLHVQDLQNKSEPISYTLTVEDPFWIKLEFDSSGKVLGLATDKGDIFFWDVEFHALTYILHVEGAIQDFRYKNNKLGVLLKDEDKKLRIEEFDLLTNEKKIIKAAGSAGDFFIDYWKPNRSLKGKEFSVLRLLLSKEQEEEKVKKSFIHHPLGSLRARVLSNRKIVFKELSSKEGNVIHELNLSSVSSNIREIGFDNTGENLLVRVGHAPYLAMKNWGEWYDSLQIYTLYNEKAYNQLTFAQRLAYFYITSHKLSYAHLNKVPEIKNLLANIPATLRESFKTNSTGKCLCS